MNHMGYGFDSPFVFNGERAIIDPKDLGLVNGHLAVGTPQTSVTAIKGLYAPPFASSNFSYDIRFMGEIVRPTDWEWLPNAIWRKGCVNQVCIESITALSAGKRSLVLTIDLESLADESKNVSVQVWLNGGIDWVHQWEFGKPVADKTGDLYIENDKIRLINNDKAWCVGTDLKDMRWFSTAKLWEGNIHLSSHEKKRVYFDISIGYVEEAVTPKNREIEVRSAFDWLSARELEIFNKLPRLQSSDPRLTAYYNRSLMHYITNRWEVDEFILKPYYANGSINGGCLCCYLWDYSGGWSVHPLVDPKADKEHIKQFLKVDLSRCFAFTPVDGAAYGPWYPINQEKIIALVYYYVKHTGDIDFLYEEVNGKSIISLVNYHACLKDDLSRPVSLYDYGVDGEHHLELRRGIPYHGVLPDLNARRYLGYIRAAELLELVGEDGNTLRERAAQLKRVLREQLWDDDRKWFLFKHGGQTDIRYTVQMYKLIGSPVLDDDMLAGLLSHLNEREFLSEFGLHSMSKLDTAYDQVDIDNGGGGICTLFTQLIAEKLYQCGYAEEANDLLSRTLWWAERMPYWGDSFVANAVEYRQDTPYQCAIGSVSGVQAILFGLCGIKAEFNGIISISPAMKRLAKEISVTDMHLRGKIFSLYMHEDRFVVQCGDKEYSAKYGETIMLS